MVVEISKFEAENIIENRNKLGLFYFEDFKQPSIVVEDSGYQRIIEDEYVIVAIDNSSGEAFTEEFKSLEKATKWLTKYQ